MHICIILCTQLLRDTSGVLLLSRTAEAATRLRHLFENKMILKNYWLVTIGKLCL